MVTRSIDSALWLSRRESGRFWNSHYRLGGTSGPGSSGALASYKANFVNRFVEEHGIQSVVDFGCGDGAQLSLLKCPVYIGLDVSNVALTRCIQKFESDDSKSFFIYQPELFVDKGSVFRSEMAISLDVIFHLVEDRTYEFYMRQLFDSAQRFVVIYSSNLNDSSGQPRYSRHREIVKWVTNNRQDWGVNSNPANPYSTMTMASFFVFERKWIAPE